MLDPDAWSWMPGAALGRTADVCSWSVVWQRRDMLGHKSESVRVLSVMENGRGELEKVFWHVGKTAPYLSLRENARNGARGCRGVVSGVLWVVHPKQRGPP